MRLPWLVLALPVALLVGSGCSTTASNLPAGSLCSRSVQCMAGLACVGGMCSNDVGGLMDGSSLPPVDMGNAEAAAMVDTGMPPVDMGTMPPVDMGPPPPVDMGPPPPVDAGPPDLGPVDAGVTD